MKIIHRGILASEKLLEGTCVYCFTKVEYRQDEAKVSPDQRDAGATYVDCPVCNHTIWGREKRPNA